MTEKKDLKTYVAERWELFGMRRLQKKLGLIYVGDGIYVHPTKIRKIEAPEGETGKRLIEEAQKNNKLIDATDKLGTQAIIVTEKGMVVLSSNKLEVVKRIITKTRSLESKITGSTTAE